MRNFTEYFFLLLLPMSITFDNLGWTTKEDRDLDNNHDHNFLLSLIFHQKVTTRLDSVMDFREKVKSKLLLKFKMISTELICF